MKALHVLSELVESEAEGGIVKCVKFFFFIATYL